MGLVREVELPVAHTDLIACIADRTIAREFCLGLGFQQLASQIRSAMGSLPCLIAARAKPRKSSPDISSDMELQHALD
jgi:hypothetical protein